MGELLIYGATGFSGRLLAREAVRRGLQPILAGRNDEKLARIGGATGLRSRAFALDEPRAFERALAGVSVVLNAAGPFSATAGPLVTACIRHGVHYLDLTGETRVIEAAAQQDRYARATGTMIMPAVGFDVVPSDCLAAHVCRRAGPAVTSLHIGVSGLESMSRGAALSIIDTLDRPVLARRNGRLTPLGAGGRARSFDFGAGPRAATAVTWGDLSTAYFSTGVGNVTTYFEGTFAVRTHARLARAFGGMVAFTPWQSMLSGLVPFLPEGPSAAVRGRRTAAVVVEAEVDGRIVARARAQTPEAYTFTTESALAIATRVAGGDYEPGFQTPSRVFGPDLLAAMSGVRRQDA
jgi:short subunit dehydrogenase-like uncharacterized protein